MSSAGTQYQIAITIAGNVSKSFQNAIAQAQQSVTTLGSLGKGAQIGLNALNALGKAGSASLKTAAGAMSAAGAGLAAIGASSISTGREFEAAMSSAIATAGPAADEYDAVYAKMEAAAMEAGRTTSKTAAESANALEYMALAGWDVDTSVAALPDILRASEATGMELAHCSDIITDSMSAAGVAVTGMSAGVNGLTGYLDVATKAQNKSNQSAEQMMEALIGVGGTMKGLNVPVQDTATALGVLANRGIKGSEAGTALSAIMINLTSGTGAAGKMMESLGLSAFDSAGKFIGLEATLQRVNKATAGMTEEQRNAVLAAIGGKHHIDALNDLMAGLNTTTAEGVSEWQALNTELYNADGALAAMRGAKLDNLNGDLSTFNSALDDTRIRIYKNIQDPLRGTVQFGTEQIYRLSDALTAGGFVAMAETMGDVLADCLMEGARAAPQFVQMAGGLAQGMIRGLVDNGPALTSAAATLVSSVLQTFFGFYGDFWSSGALLFAQFLQGIAGQMPQIIQSGAAAVRTLSAGITAQAPAIFSAAGQIIIQLLQGFAIVTPELFAMGGTLLLQLGQGILNGLPVLTDTALTIMSNFGQYIQANLPFLLQSGLTMVLALSASIRQNAGRLIDGAIALALNLARGLANSIPVIVSTVPTIISNIAGVINDNAPRVLLAGVRIIATLALGLIRAIPVIIQNIPFIIKAIFDAFTAVNWFDLGASLLQEFGRGILSVDWMQVGKDLLDAIFNSIRSAAGGLWDAALNFFTGGGKNAADSAAAGITAGTPAIEAAASSAATAAAYSFQIDAGLMSEYGNSAAFTLTDSMTNGILAGTDSLNATVANLGTSAADALNASITNSFPDIYAPALASGLAITDGITSGIDSGMADAAATAANASVDTIDAMANGISAGASTINGTVSDLTDSVTASLDQCWANVSETASASWTGIGENMQSGLSAMSSGVTAQLDVIQSAMENSATAFSGFSGTFSNTMTDTMTGVQSAINTGAQGWNAEMSAAMDTLGGTIDAGMISMTDSTGNALAAVQGTVQGGMTEITSTVDTSIQAMAATTENGITVMGTAIQSGFSAMQSTAQSSFSTIRSSIETEMSRAVQAVRDAVSAMQSAMNFTWKLPDLKVPKVNVSGAFSLEPPTAPSFDVTWHREGGILSGAQIFGMQYKFPNLRYYRNFRIRCSFVDGLVFSG